MIKKDTLYTANKWNMPLFIPEEKKNLFFDAGQMETVSQLAQADYQKNPWNYSQDYMYGNGAGLTEQYLNSKNVFGISKANNPFSKVNIGKYFRKNNNVVIPTTTNYYNQSSNTIGQLPPINWSDSKFNGLGVSATKGIVDTFGQKSKQFANSFGKGPLLENESPFAKDQSQTVNSDNPQAFFNLGSSGAELAGFLLNKNGNSGGGGSKLFSKEAWQEGGAGWGLAATAANTVGSIQTGERRGMWDTLDPVHHLAGGRETGVGNAMGDLGTGVFSAGLASGNPYIMAAGAALKVIGGLTNAAWGTKTDKKKLEAANNSIAQNRNFVSNAGDYDDIDLSGIASMVSTGGTYKGGWFSSGDASKKNEALKKDVQDAYSWATRSVDNNMNNIFSDKISNYLYNYHAFGGPIETIPMFNSNNNNMGAVEYGFMSDYLDTKKKNADNKNQMTNMFMSTPSTMFDFGGDLQTNSADFPTGLTHIDAGGSHEGNPNDGVQMGVDREGTPNLVEEGETVFNDYVFSNRILADEATKKLFHLPKKKDITFADISKKLEKEISERPNDPISEAGFKAQMQTLEEQQERQKQQMEAERAKAAFEALSPEEQTAIMQRAAQEEAMAQQAVVQQAQQPTPEEVAMMQQQQMMQADGSQAVVGQEPQQFAEGGDMKKRLYKLLGISTDSEYKAWLKKNNLDDLKDAEDFDNILKNEAIMKAATKDNPALADAISRGYDFGAYKPLNNGKTTIKSISKGNWKATNGLGWIGSDDPAWTEAVKGMSDEDIKKLSTEDVAKLMRATDSYKKGSEWLQNKDNALLYLNTLMNDPDTPQAAKDYAAKFVKDGQWKDGFNFDYATVFGSNGKGVRETNPGTYWHTPVEAIRGDMAKNMVINPDGTVEEIVGDVPTDWTAAGNYAWQTPESDITYNYYNRPTAAKTPEQMAVIEEETKPLERRVRPVYSNNLFGVEDLGPLLGLGMMAAGVGKPNTASLDAAVENAGTVARAGYKPLGDYMKFVPLDRMFKQNSLDASARAAERTILNSSMPASTKYAALLANNYNNQLASGNLFRQEQEYNDALREKVAAFNRGTNQFNADAYNQTSRFNADAINRARQGRASLALQAAAQKMDADAGWYNSLYGNINSISQNLGARRKENRQRNMIADMAASGIYGVINPDNFNPNGMLRWETDDEYQKRLAKQAKQAACGGNIRKKKGKRGLTL